MHVSLHREKKTSQLSTGTREMDSWDRAGQGDKAFESRIEMFDASMLSVAFASSLGPRVAKRRWLSCLAFCLQECKVPIPSTGICCARPRISVASVLSYPYPSPSHGF